MYFIKPKCIKSVVSPLTYKWILWLNSVKYIISNHKISFTEYSSGRMDQSFWERSENYFLKDKDSFVDKTWIWDRVYLEPIARVLTAIFVFWFYLHVATPSAIIFLPIFALSALTFMWVFDTLSWEFTFNWIAWLFLSFPAKIPFFLVALMIYL